MPLLVHETWGFQKMEEKKTKSIHCMKMINYSKFT